jgi:magnesium transporter
MLRPMTIEQPEPSVSILVHRGDGRIESLSADRLDDLDRLLASDGKLLWVHLSRPSAETIDRVGAEFGIHPLAIEDLRKQRQRPKLDSYENQRHLVAYAAAPGALGRLAELQLVIGPTWVLSVHWDATPMVDAAHARVARGVEELGGTLAGIVYLVLDAVADSFFPELDQVSERIDALEDDVISEQPDPRTLREILGLKRSLLEQRRVLGPMRDVANALLRGDGDLVDRRMIPYY